jgi:carbonic anhydrase
MTHRSADRSRNRVRRSVIVSLGAGVVAGCAVCSSTIRAMAAASGDGHSAAVPGHPPHWSYEGEAGPLHWGELSPDFKSCQLGLEQTPIDLKAPITAELGKAVDVVYQARRFRILNNGHTIQVNVEPGSHCVIAGEQYELLQYHFHHPSEHLLAGKGFDLECHFVHRAASGNLAVLGVFVAPGADNATLKPIFDAMPTEEGRERYVATPLNPADLLPRGNGFFRYMGSLTTPPCSEGLVWTVFKHAIEASPAQIRQFAALFPNNARPLQELHRRFLLQSS